MEWGLNEYFEMVPAATARPERELVPDGTYVMKIERASEAGPLVKVALSHDDSRYGWVFANMYQDREIGQRLGTELRIALGMTPEEWRTSKIDDIVGRRVTVEIYQQVKDRTYVNVRRFKPAPEPAAAAAPPPAAKPAARTTAKKADAVGHDPDDIPF
jgi:hypothetical protein